MTVSRDIGRGRGERTRRVKYKYVDAETRADITVPIYRVLYKGEMLYCESNASTALARIPTDREGWTIEARVELKTWTCWPPEKATQPKEDEE